MGKRILLLIFCLITILSSCSEVVTVNDVKGWWYWPDSPTEGEAEYIEIFQKEDRTYNIALVTTDACTGARSESPLTFNSRKIDFIDYNEEDYIVEGTGRVSANGKLCVTLKYKWPDGGRRIERRTYFRTEKPKGPTSIYSAESINIEIMEYAGLIYYFPNYKTIDLVCETMPEPSDKSVLFCCEAAFTGLPLDGTFSHSKIAGNHVSGGAFYKGFSCVANTGCFAFYPDDGTWTFAIGDYHKYIEQAAERGGMAFGQAMLFLNGNEVKARAPQKPDRKAKFRVLAEYNGKLCIIDTKEVVKYEDFVKMLGNAEVTNALYMDMGPGLDFSWYRNNDGGYELLNPDRIAYTTNWVVFKK